jgi:hypothetical protein
MLFFTKFLTHKKVEATLIHTLPRRVFQSLKLSFSFAGLDGPFLNIKCAINHEVL